jgi:hypothetical protein
LTAEPAALPASSACSIGAENGLQSWLIGGRKVNQNLHKCGRYQSVHKGGSYHFFTRVVDVKVSTRVTDIQVVIVLAVDCSASGTASFDSLRTSALAPAASCGCSSGLLHHWLMMQHKHLAVKVTANNPPPAAA